MWIFTIFLALLLASALFVHLRGRERHRFRRQLTDQSTFLAPYNALMYAFSAVPRGPFLDVADFPELAPLRENWKVIRDEALRLHERGLLGAPARHDDVAFNSFFKRGWRRFYLKWYDDFLPSAHEACPRTLELVQAIPNVHAALFTYMPPHSKTSKHRDPFAGSLRYHLGLVTPGADACRIYVDGQAYSWRDGEDVVFDETFIHRAFNDTDEDRIILFCDVERPLHTPFMRSINRFVTHRVARATAGRNREDEPLGLVNRFSGRIYTLSRLRRRMRHEHRILYRVAEVALAAVLVLLAATPFLLR